MQATNPVSSSPSLNAYLEEEEFVETEAKLCDEFGAKLIFEASDDNKLEKSESPDEKTLEDEEQQEPEHEIEDDDDNDDDDDDDDFSFVCSGVDTSPVAAEDAFQDGQIRPFFPLFNQDLLLDYESELRKIQLPRRPPVRKVFVETRDSPLPPLAAESENSEIEVQAAGPYCAWTKKAVEASPDSCKKSNSTGFSKLWRFRDLLNRSNSDGRDAYVFLTSSTTTTTATGSTMSAKREDKVEKTESSSLSSSSSERNVAGEAKIPSAGGKTKAKAKAKKVVKGSQTASLSAHEVHYMRNRASKEEDRHRSYLPYRPGLVGFFTNVNGGMSRNVHPF